MSFDMKKTEARARRISRARRVAQVEEHRLNVALASRSALVQSVYVGDVDGLDTTSGVAVPVVVVERGERWTFKVASAIESEGRIEVTTASAVPLADCPTNLLVRFAKRRILTELVDDVLAEELLAPGTPEAHA